MSRQPIVVGVDASYEAVLAATVAVDLAARAGVPCQLVHAVREFWFTGVGSAEITSQTAEFNRAIVQEARAHVTQALKAEIPASLIDSLIIEGGNPAEVINRVAERLGAQLIVLGGKHHSALGRWLSGSTSLNVARTATLPVLVTAGARLPIRHVMAAVDLSAAAGPTLDLAHRFATLLRTELQVLSVFEPLPVFSDGAVPAIDSTRYYELCEETLQKDLGPRLETWGGSLTIRHGSPVATILREATLWPAGLLVVGSHGKTWAQRLLLGSVTEKLLNHLPASVLVVPVAVTAPVEAAIPAAPALATA
jgi:nucleotide-binding universal stress UspA family protein